MLGLGTRVTAYSAIPLQQAINLISGKEIFCISCLFNACLSGGLSEFGRAVP